MTLVAVASLKASPGATTTAVALAAVWPRQERPLVVEADPDGGSLAARAQLGVEPGLVTATLAARHAEATPDTLLRHAQAHPGGIPVLVGPASAVHAHTTLATPSRLLELARDLERDVVVDCGRLSPARPSLEAIAAHVDLLVVVARPRLEEVAHLAEGLPTFAASGTPVAFALIGERPHPPDEVAAVVDADLLGVVADDPDTATQLTDMLADPDTFTRTPLGRSTARLARTITTRTEPTATTTPASADGAPPPPAPQHRPAAPATAAEAGDAHDPVPPEPAMDMEARR